MKPQTALIIGGVALGALVVWLLGRRLLEGGDALLDLPGKLGELITRDGPVAVVDGAVLPNGTRVTFDQIVAAGGSVDSRYEFVWLSVRYRLTGRRADGWYNAVRAT